MTAKKCKKPKTFVIDTNVLLHAADSIEKFQDNCIVLPMAVIEELDHFKTRNDELGRNARQVIRRLDSLRSRGNLRDGVPMAGGGTLRIQSAREGAAADQGLKDATADNRILGVAYDIHCSGETVTFVSKDINARIKADALGLQARDFENEKVNFDELYSGLSQVEVPLKTIQGFFKAAVYDAEGIGSYPNEFVNMVQRTRKTKPKTALARVLRPGKLVHLSSQLEHVWNIQARNKEQRLALELLMDPSVQIVTLVGQAGTGKTLLALAAALHSTLRQHRYDRILVTRPIVPMGNDIGYLPGGKEEKLMHWMQPIFDNLTYLINEEIKNSAATSSTTTNSGRKRRGRPKPADRINELLTSGALALEALTYIRGRSIPKQYVIVDEAQNLTPHEVKTIVSRAGEDTKMVLTGDPYQIDNPYLDASSNGLTYATERLKEHSLHGHVTLHKSERSHLAAVAAEYL
jgi:PhoH-like ATPase